MVAKINFFNNDFLWLCGFCANMVYIIFSKLLNFQIKNLKIIKLLQNKCGLYICIDNKKNVHHNHHSKSLAS